MTLWPRTAWILTFMALQTPSRPDRPGGVEPGEFRTGGTPVGTPHPRSWQCSSSISSRSPRLIRGPLEEPAFAGAADADGCLRFPFGEDGVPLEHFISAVNSPPDSAVAEGFPRHGHPVRAGNSCADERPGCKDEHVAGAPKMRPGLDFVENTRDAETGTAHDVPCQRLGPRLPLGSLAGPTLKIFPAWPPEYTGSPLFFFCRDFP